MTRIHMMILWELEMKAKIQTKTTATNMPWHIRGGDNLLAPPGSANYICDGQALMAAIWCVASDQATCLNEQWYSKSTNAFDVKHCAYWPTKCGLSCLEHKFCISPAEKMIHQHFLPKSKIAISLSKVPSGRLFHVHLLPARNSKHVYHGQHVQLTQQQVHK